MTQTAERGEAVPPGTMTPLGLVQAAGIPIGDALAELASTVDGLSTQEAATRLDQVGPNAVREHGANGWGVLARQPVAGALGRNCPRVVLPRGTQ